MTKPQNQEQSERVYTAYTFKIVIIPFRTYEEYINTVPLKLILAIMNSHRYAGEGRGFRLEGNSIKGCLVYPCGTRADANKFECEILTAVQNEHVTALMSRFAPHACKPASFRYPSYSDDE